MQNRFTRAALPAAAILAAAALPFLVPGYYVQFASKVLILGMLAMALNLVVGYGGLVSLCHAALYGLAGYVLALAAPQYEPASLWTTLPLAVGASALAALAIGALSLRTRGNLLHHGHARLWRDAVLPVPRYANRRRLRRRLHLLQAGGGDRRRASARPGEPADLLFRRARLRLRHGGPAAGRDRLGQYGHALAAARDNERRARSLGFPVYRLRLIAFVLSGALAGLAGYLAAAQFGFVAPQMLGWHLSATVLVMVVLGGMRTVTGPLVEQIALMGLEEVLKATTVHWKLIEGLVIIALVLALPGGVRQLGALLLGSSMSRDRLAARESGRV